MLTEEVYLGDAVYASFDGYQIWLRTDDGNNNRIALDQRTYFNLLSYADNLRETINEQDRKLVEGSLKL